MLRLTELRFTKHATEKFALLSRFGFLVSKDEVIAAIEEPERIERRGKQILSTKILDETYALRVVHEERERVIIVITFYPFRRERYGL